MRKVFVIAVREYNAAVRTKAFLISLVMMPLLMGGSILMQELLRNRPPTEVKHFDVLDRTDGRELFDAVRARAATVQGADQKPLLVVNQVGPVARSEAALAELRREEAAKLRGGAIAGFLEIGPDVLQPADPRDPDPEYRHALVYRSSRPLEQSFPRLAAEAVNARVRELRGKGMGLAPGQVRSLVQAVPLEQNQAGFFVTLGLTMLMYMVVMLTTAPLMQGVLEEKMNRIAEVLLGSVRPFPLMLGKLLGMTAAALTISVVYLVGGWYAAHHYGLDEYLPPSLMVWFVVFQTLAVLMFGSLFSAVGAACTDMKETQSLMWPVMMLVMIPFFVLIPILQEPNGTLATAVSLFPFATPMLMVGRLGAAPGMPLWQPVAGVAVVLATTLLCVWAAGRVFRVGLLMQGKGARLGDLARWVLRG
jgi:ABC-2 type transport system permease protein